KCSTTASDIQNINSAPNLPPPAQSPGAASQAQVPCGALIAVPASMPGRFRVAGKNVPISFLAEMAGTAPITGFDRLVLARTGLNATYDINIESTPTVPLGIAPPGFTPDDSGPSFTQALQDQLGLKLEPQTGPVDVVVIDHVEEPSP